MGGPKGADRSANLGEVSTGATEGSEARSEPRVARDATCPSDHASGPAAREQKPSVSEAFKPFSLVLDSDPTVQYYSEQDRHD